MKWTYYWELTDDEYYKQDRPNNDLYTPSPPTHSNKFHIPTSSDPPFKSIISLPLLTFLSQLKNSILKLKLPNTYNYNVYKNISKRSTDELNSLRRNLDIIIKPADKNLGLVILDTKWYTDELLRQLKDRRIYTPCSYEKEYDIIRKVNAKVFILIKNNTIYFGDKEKKYLFKNTNLQRSNIKIPQIYILPKIHKIIMAGRPIVPCTTWVTRWLSVWLDHRLQPYLKYIPYHLKDSTTLLNHLQNYPYNRADNILLLTADVSSLYTEIPTNDGITLMREFLIHIMKYHDIFLSSGTINLYIEALKLILDNNYLINNNTIYRQCDGTAMGTSVAPTYAIIFMFMIENNQVKNLIGDQKIYLYRRYIDDILIITKKCNENEIKTSLSKLHKNIKLTFESSEDGINFLDIYIYKGQRYNNPDDGRFDTTTYQKHHNAYLYIPYNSFHPPSMKKGMIKTELIRYIRTNSDLENFSKVRLLFYYRLRSRGYPIDFLVECFNQIQYSQRNCLLGNIDNSTSVTLTVPVSISKPEKAFNAPLVFVIPYDSFTRAINDNIKSLIKLFFDMYIKANYELHRIFPKAPMITFTKGKNIMQLLTQQKPRKKFLVQSTLRPPSHNYSYHNKVHQNLLRIENEQRIATKEIENRK